MFSHPGFCSTYTYVGQHQKATENDFSIPVMQMGARVYLPSLGRFAQVDPVEGGTDNNYAYTNQPITEYDLDGKAAWGPIIGAAIACLKFCAKIWKKTEPIRNKIGAVMYNSKHFGRKSKLFGSKQLGASQSGKWNNNNILRVGWSTHKGQKTFRVAIGKNKTLLHRELILAKGRYR